MVIVRDQRQLPRHLPQVHELLERVGRVVQDAGVVDDVVRPEAADRLRVLEVALHVAHQRVALGLLLLEPAPLGVAGRDEIGVADVEQGHVGGAGGLGEERHVAHELVHAADVGERPAGNVLFDPICAVRRS